MAVSVNWVSLLWAPYYSGASIKAALFPKLLPKMETQKVLLGLHKATERRGGEGPLATPMLQGRWQPHRRPDKTNSYLGLPMQLLFSSYVPLKENGQLQVSKGTTSEGSGTFAARSPHLDEVSHGAAVAAGLSDGWGHCSPTR